MAIDFPASPSVNDIHTSGGKRWTWNGTSWERSGTPGPGDTISATNDNTTSTLYPVLVTGTGSNTAKIATTSSKSVSFNASNGNLTATTFTGILNTAAQTNITSVGTLGSLNVTGNATIGGVLTYEDVKNVDSVGIVTAREGIFLPDSKKIKLGNTSASPDFTIEHNGSNGIIDTNTGDLILRSDADDIKILAEDDIVLRDNDDSTNFIHCINGAGVRLYNAGNERLYTTNTGIDVTGTGTFSSTVSVNSGNLDINDSIRHIGDTDTKIRFPADDTITFETNGDQALEITSGGGVKFNDADTPGSTTAPAQILNHSGGWQFYGSSAEGTHRNIIFGTNDRSAGERLRIESSGRVGINTTSARVNGLHIYDKHLAVTEGYPITWLQPNSSTSRGRMTCDSGGNYLFQFGSGNDEKIRFKSNGAVGIGTVNPTSLLTVGARPKTTSAVATVLISPASGNASIQLRGGSPTLEFDGTGGGNGQIFTDNADLAISNGTLDSAGTELVRITSDGDVFMGGLTSKSSESTAILSVEGGDSNIGIINVHAGSGEDAGELAGITFSHGGSANSTSRAKAAIALRAIGSYGRGDLCFYVDGTADNNGVAAADEKLRITSGGKVCIAHTNALHSGNLQVSTTGADAIDINSYSTSADNGGRLSFYRSKNASIGSNTIVADDDSLGRIDFRGYNTNGNSYNQGATIEARVDGSVNSSTDMPSAILFKTSADGSASPTERLRITSGGHTVTQGLTSYSFNNDSANVKIFEVTGDGTVGEYGVINISGNQNANNGNIGTLRFVNRENSTSSSTGSATSKQVASIQAYIRTSDTNAGDDSGGILTFHTKGEDEVNSEKVRIDEAGRLLIGNFGSDIGDSKLQVYTSDRKHPAIRTNSPNANGYTMFGDAYQSDESQVNIGVSYSSSSLVISRSCKVSDTADNAYLSSQDTYATRPCALRLSNDGAISFHTTETNATVATDSAVSLTEVFSIDRVGNIRQKISSRYMYFGANQELQIGVNGSDGYLNSASGDLQIRDAGNPITIVRSDGFQMYQDIYFAAAGKGICLGTTSNTDSNTLDDYEEGDLTWYLRKSGSTSTGNDTGSVVKYTKVGRMVHISGRIRTDSVGSASNDYFYLDGTLPFTPVTPGTSVVGHWRSQDQLDNSLTASIAWLADSTTIYLYTIDSKSDYNASSNNVPASHQTNLVMTFSFTYQAT